MITSYQNSIDEILGTMTRFGGLFIKQLVVLYHVADTTNRTALEGTFSSYFKRYDEFTSTHKTKGLR